MKYLLAGVVVLGGIVLTGVGMSALSERNFPIGFFHFCLGLALIIGGLFMVIEKVVLTKDYCDICDLKDEVLKIPYKETNLFKICSSCAGRVLVTFNPQTKSFIVR